MVMLMGLVERKQKAPAPIERQANVAVGFRRCQLDMGFAQNLAAFKSGSGTMRPIPFIDAMERVWAAAGGAVRLVAGIGAGDRYYPVPVPKPTAWYDMTAIGGAVRPEFGSEGFAQMHYQTASEY